jgi:biotin operon repressor
VRVLISTFGSEDADRVLQAMRQLPYDKLVLVGDDRVQESDAFARLNNLEEMAGHTIDFETVDHDDFMALVDGVSETLSRHGDSGKNQVVLNISGGSKLLGDAALLAAFRVGVETFHIDDRVTKLPVLRGATARDRFTPSQVKLIELIGDQDPALGDLITGMLPSSRQSAERVVRELRKQGMLISEVRDSKVHLSLSPTGLEVLRAVRLTIRNKKD